MAPQKPCMRGAAPGEQIPEVAWSLFAGWGKEVVRARLPRAGQRWSKPSRTGRLFGVEIRTLCFAARSPVWILPADFVERFQSAVASNTFEVALRTTGGLGAKTMPP